MVLEDDLNITNKYYLENDIAVIYKKPTPITINHVNYPNRAYAVITDAKFKIPSTTDYNGIYKGKYIDFEAKETSSKTSFPLANIHIHQIEHLRKIVKHGGIGFIIVSFSKLNRIFLLKAEDLFYFLDNNNRKSIPLEYFETRGKEMKISLRPRIDYLKYIE
jgi:recombination protein U